MKCISLYQPWASWVAMGWKTIETRAHKRFRRLAGQRIAIHAAKKFDEYAIPHMAYPYLVARGYWNYHTDNPFALARGCILCTVFVAKHRSVTDKDSPDALCDCSGGGLYGLVFKDIQLLKYPHPFPGQQGIFDVHDEFFIYN
jgi:hypothetical protein